MAQFRTSWYELAPPWLRTGVGEQYMYTLELMRDLLMEKCAQAVNIRIPGKGHPSQIPYLAHDRQLLQGPNETDEAFIGRLSDAFDTWGEAGSAFAVLGQLQVHTQGFQPGIPDTAPILRIVSDKRFRDDTDSDGISSWYTVRAGDPMGQRPTLSNVTPHNFNWSSGVVGELPRVWRAWLVLFQYAVTTGQSGSGLAYASSGGGSFTDPGHNVGGVWVPRTSGTPVNAPFITLTGLSGLTADNLGDVLTITGSAHRDNNGTFQIVEVLSSSSCVIVNQSATVPDAGPLGWSIARFPWIPPNLPLGSPGQVWGEGETVIPPVDTGSNRLGLWRPTQLAGIGSSPSYSWGLRTSSLTLETIRGLTKTWKSARAYYPNIIVCYDGPDGAFSPTSSFPFNPDGGFESVGRIASGVWVPTRKITSDWDAYCQGTGQALACGVENIT